MKSLQVIYKPWSPRTLASCIKAYKKGQIPVLNLDLTAKCTFCSCLYCDSKVGKPYANELTDNQVMPLIKELHVRYGLRWIFVCGLGEPAEDPKLFRILETAKSLGIEVSLFSNGIGFADKDIGRLAELPVNIILKLDSFDEKTFDTILGGHGRAKRIYSFLEKLLQSGFVKVKNHETNLSLSIVPTKLNFMHIDQVVEFCKKNYIFPAIGEMEASNRAIENYQELALAKDQLIFLRSNVSRILGYEYGRPLCPGIIPSLHITNTGDCVVHKQTGLSCGWFFMDEVKYEVIGNICREPLETLLSGINNYRLETQRSAELLLDQHRPVFGGGGSHPDKWRMLYFSLLTRIAKYDAPEGKRRSLWRTGKSGRESVL